MNKAEIDALADKAMAKDTLKQLFEQTLQERVDRWCDVRPHNITSNPHFASVSAEVYYLYRDGHFYGAIALSQAVAEALARFLCIRNNDGVSSFENNILKLKKKDKISDQVSDDFNHLWQGRNDYHHLNPSIEKDRQTLEAVAKEKLKALQRIEAEVFAYTTDNGERA